MVIRHINMSNGLRSCQIPMMEIFWENFKLISGISQKSHSKNRLCWRPFDDDDDDDDELFLGYG